MIHRIILPKSIIFVDFSTLVAEARNMQDVVNSIYSRFILLLLLLCKIYIF